MDSSITLDGTKMEEALNKLLASCGWGDLIQITSQQKRFSEQSMRILFKISVKHATQVMNIAAGIAQIKGKEYVCQTEIEQAIIMKEDGVDNFIPEVSGKI